MNQEYVSELSKIKWIGILIRNQMSLNLICIAILCMVWVVQVHSNLNLSDKKYCHHQKSWKGSNERLNYLNGDSLSQGSKIERLIASKFLESQQNISLVTPFEKIFNLVFVTDCSLCERYFTQKLYGIIVFRCSHLIVFFFWKIKCEWTYVVKVAFHLYTFRIVFSTFWKTGQHRETTYWIFVWTKFP